MYSALRSYSTFDIGHCRIGLMTLCSPIRIFRRQLHLIQQVHSPEKLLSFTQASIPSPENLSFQLLGENGRKYGKKSLSETLELIKPPYHLVKSKRSGPPVYRIAFLDMVPCTIMASNGTGITIELRTTMSLDPYSTLLGKAYTALLNGRSVEFHLYPSGEHKKITVNQSLSKRIYLRPDTILAAMPEGTAFMVRPVMDGDNMIWIFKNNKNGKGRRFESLEDGSLKEPRVTEDESSSSSFGAAFKPRGLTVREAKGPYIRRVKI